MTLSPKLELEPEDDFLEETLLEEEEEEELALTLLPDDEEATAATAEDFLEGRDCEREALMAGFFFGRTAFLSGSGDFEAARRLTLLGEGDGEGDGATFFFGATAAAFLATVFLAGAAGFLTEEDLEAAAEAAGFLGVADFLEEAFLGALTEVVRFFAGTDDFLVAGAILCFILYICVWLRCCLAERVSFFLTLSQSIGGREIGAI